MSATPSAEDLQRQMQQVRVEMREDVQVMVANAREMTDWTWYVRTYPWVCVGAAAAIGFLVVPSRSRPVIKPDAKDLIELAKHQKIVVKMEEPKSSSSLLGTLARMAAGSLLQGGMAVVSHQLDQMLKQPREPRPVSSNGNGRGSVHG
jgi:hypothetical protein